MAVFLYLEKNIKSVIILIIKLNKKVVIFMEIILSIIISLFGVMFIFQTGPFGLALLLFGIGLYTGILLAIFKCIIGILTIILASIVYLFENIFGSSKK